MERFVVGVRGISITDVEMEEAQATLPDYELLFNLTDVSKMSNEQPP